MSELESDLELQGILETELSRLGRRMSLVSRKLAEDPVLQQYAEKQCLTERQFARLPTRQDIKYRGTLGAFTRSVSKLEYLSHLALSAHGTPYRNVPLILGDGTITNTETREGIRTSYDTGDIISTAPLNCVGVCMGYVETTRWAQPLGALFIIEEETLGAGIVSRPLHESLAFVVTGPEKVGEVADLLRQNGFTNAQAIEYFEFLNLLEQGSDISSE